jgi:hypothetical protein
VAARVVRTLRLGEVKRRDSLPAPTRCVGGQAGRSSTQSMALGRRASLLKPGLLARIPKKQGSRPWADTGTTRRKRSFGAINALGIEARPSRDAGQNCSPYGARPLSCGLVEPVAWCFNLGVLTWFPARQALKASSRCESDKSSVAAQRRLPHGLRAWLAIAKGQNVIRRVALLGISAGPNPNADLFRSRLGELGGRTKKPRPG